MKAHQILSREEIRHLTTASDLQGALSVIGTWGIIAATFALVVAYPSVVTVALAVVLLGGRHLALAVLTHECAHRSLFKTTWLNHVIGKWVCGAPIWVDVERYRKLHLSHHAHAGSPEDPDLPLVVGFPVSRASFARKVMRDLTVLAGLRRVVAHVLMDVGLLQYATSDKPGAAEKVRPSAAVIGRRFVVNTGPVLLTNALLFAALWAVGAPWAYVLWVVAYLTTFSLFFRLRSIAEHACTDSSSPDPMRHTRTTLASPLARLTVAPHHVNYHAEHHLLPTAPHYRLPALHRLLVERGAFGEGYLSDSYRDVLRVVVSVS